MRPAFKRKSDGGIIDGMSAIVYDTFMQLVGDATKARKDLGWAPSIDFKQMICEMVDSDITLLKTQRIV